MLVWSILPFILFSVLLVILVVVDRKEKKRVAESRESQHVVAKIANGLHEKKYGEPSPELIKEFPELKLVKGSQN